jgi:hypothetical protein
MLFMRQLLICVLIVACRPIGTAPTPWNEAATLFIQEKTGAGGVRKPGRKPEKSKPDEPRGRPVNKNRCLDSAAAGSAVWTAFCRDIKDDSLRKRCFAVGLESEQRRRGFCNNFF